MHLIENGTPVKVDQGFGIYTIGVIEDYEIRPTPTGNKIYYKVKVTGGRDVFKRRARIGRVISVHSSNVSVNHLRVVS
jgi:hypothetical protein